MARKMYAGGAPATTLNGGINSTTTTIVVTSGTGYPSGSTGNFWIVIDRGLAAEEKVLCSATAGNTITAVDRTSAGNRDGTTNATHATAAVVEHCFAAQDADEANAHINTTTDDNHTQYSLVAGTRAFTGVTAIANSTPTTSAVGDAAAIGSGNVLARSTHVHGREAFATPVAVGAANAAGAAATVPRSDHVHASTVGTAGFTAHTSDTAITTSYADIVSVTLTTVTGRRYKITGHVNVNISSPSHVVTGKMVEGATLFGYDSLSSEGFSSATGSLHFEAVVTPSAASHTYKVQAVATLNGISSIIDATGGPGFILVEDIGV